MGAMLKFEVAATWIECATCHISFGLTDETLRRIRESHEDFHCPKGHVNVFLGQSEAERVRKQMQATIDAASRKIEWLRAEAETAKETAEAAKLAAKLSKKQATVAKSRLTKMKTRVEAGVCPHCNRTFPKLAAHMLTKHSEEIHADAEQQASAEMGGQ